MAIQTGLTLRGVERLKSIPIAVFAHRRPVHLSLTLESLGRCSGYEETDLFVYCDAARASAEAPVVEKTCKVARAWVSEHGGKVVEREENMGFRNIVSGITELCARYGRVIVVEDDLVVSPDFLRYMRESLDRYEREPRVFLVSGFMYAVRHPPKPEVFFLPVSLTWGWGTWERAWKSFDWDADGWREFLADPRLRKRFDVNGCFPFSRMLESTMTGKLKTWDIQWCYAVFRAGGLGLYPRQSLVWNTGMGCGAHGRGQEPVLDTRMKQIHGSLTREDFTRPRLPSGWTFPQKIEVDEAALRRVGRCMASMKPGFVRRQAQKVKAAILKLLKPGSRG